MPDTLHLILGATGAAGSATVARLRTADARVVIAGRDSDGLACLAEETGAEAAHQVDARDPAQVGGLITDLAPRPDDLLGHRAGHRGGRRARSGPHPPPELTGRRRPTATSPGARRRP